MKLSKKGIDLIKKYEGLRLEAYQDSVGIWTIGYGNTRLQTGLPVKKGDKITIEQAEDLFDFWVFDFAEKVRKLVKKDLSDSKFSAIVSLSYNVGINAFGASTLLKKLNINPCDETISFEFSRWNKAGGRILEGLTRRRKAESDLYFS